MKGSFGAGRDVRVLDPATEEQACFVDGKIGTRPKADVTSGDGTLLHQVRGRLLGIPKRIDVTDAAGTHGAHLHAQALTFIKEGIEVAGLGRGVAARGRRDRGGLRRQRPNGRHVIQITQEWNQIRDQHVIDIADGVEPPAALAPVWAIDRGVERD
jgi:uncharacterized protein YxjI